jgi:hypothetical protein
MQQPSMLRAHEPIGYRAIQPSQERIKEAGDIQQTNRFGVEAQLTPGDYLEELVRTADAAGQSGESGGALGHQRFTLMHRFDDM